MTIRPAIVRMRADPRPMLIAAAVTVASGIFALVPLWRLTAPDVSEDIIPHARLAVEFVESGNLFTYSLWYPLIWVATGGGNPELFRISSVVLLAFFVALKTLIAFLIAQSVFRQAWTSAIIALAVTVFAPIFNPASAHGIYIGQISATVWHNSTNILVAPFALLAFWMAMRLLHDPGWRTALVAGLATTLAVLAKPNFAIAMLPVVGVVLLVKLFRDRVPVGRSAVIIVAAAAAPLLVLIAQYVAIYGGGLQRAESLTVAPFAVWSTFSSNIPLSVFYSLFGVAVALIVVLIRRDQTPELLIAWAVLGVTVLQLIVLAEQLPDGTIATSGNWFWGSYTAMMVVALWSMTAVRDSIIRAGSTRRRVLPIIGAVALGLHVVAGIYYALVVGTPDYRSYF